MIEPKLPEYGPIQLSIRVSDMPYEEGKCAPYLHIRAYHTDRRDVVVTSFENEKIEMEVPKDFHKADMETFISICGQDILERLQKSLDAERTSPPEPLSYSSMIP